MAQGAGPLTEDRFLGGRLTLAQPAKGYRAGLDAGLLAAACDAKTGERVIEPGCGAGAALLAAAVRRPEARFLGLERDPDALALARRNIEANGLAARVEAQAGDVAEASNLGRGAFDAALCNPPFFDDPKALRAPHPAKTAAWMAEDGLAAWIAFLIRSVREGGTITLIHRADRLADILGLMAPAAGAVQIRAVHPFADAPAKRVLVRAVKGGRAPLRLLPALVLHARGGAKHTPEAEAILRGAADLPWL
ncbi:MAG: tRNA1(Val) (adenine(37)-N6)-methyltransferase [Caulobacteraceae bacterium]